MPQFEDTVGRQLPRPTKIPGSTVADETALQIAEGVLSERPDWLAVIMRRRLYIDFESSAVQQLSRELKEMGEL